VDTTLDALLGLEKALKLLLPDAPNWKLEHPDVKADMRFNYPTKGRPFPVITVKAHTIEQTSAGRELLRRLTRSVPTSLAGRQRGYFPPYEFTLIKATTQFDRKKRISDIAWAKANWVWAQKFTVRQELRDKFKTVEIVAGKLPKVKGKKAVLVGLDDFYSVQEAITDLKSILMGCANQKLKEIGRASCRERV